MNFKKIGLTLATVITFGMATAMFLKKEETKVKELSCLKNDNFYTELLIPTKKDSEYFESLPPRIHGNYTPFPHYMYMMPLVSKIADTGMFAMIKNKEHHSLEIDYSSGKTIKGLAQSVNNSPLIVLGEVINQYPEDTTNVAPYLFRTNIIIKIKEIIKSQYKCEKGDIVQAKTFVYGYLKSLNELGEPEVSYGHFGGAFEYEIGTEYLFVLDKIHYMYALWYRSQLDSSDIKKNERDIFCPYAFIIPLSSNDHSAQYATGDLTLKTIRNIINYKN